MENTRDTDWLKEREQMIQIMQKFNLFSNVFMKVVLKDVAACEHVLRILTGNLDLKVKDVRTEFEIAKVMSHDSRLDVLAEDMQGALYNLELQRETYLDHARRVRFYNAMVDSEVLEKGKDYDEMPDLTTYYISEKDIWKQKKSKYQLEKKLSEMEFPYQDGIDIVYVNAEVDDRSEVAKLMNYFQTADPYDDSQGELSKRVRFLKCEKEGQEIMCKVTDELVRIGEERGMERGMERGKALGEELGLKSVVMRMAERGKKLEEILECTGVSPELVNKWLRAAKVSS